MNPSAERAPSPPRAGGEAEAACSSRLPNPVCGLQHTVRLLHGAPHACSRGVQATARGICILCLNPARPALHITVAVLTQANEQGLFTSGMNYTPGKLPRHRHKGYPFELWASLRLHTLSAWGRRGPWLYERQCLL